MDDGLGFALIIPIFFLLIPISISSIILYIILRDKKLSVLGSMVGLPFAFWIAYSISVSKGEGIMWHLIHMDVIAMSPFAPYLMAILFGMLTAVMGLIIIKAGGLVFKKTNLKSEK